MNTKNIIFLAVVILVAGGLIGFFLVQRGIVNVPSPQQGKSAPELSLNDYSGKAVKLSDFAGKPLVLNAWAVWCPFCRKELVDFVAAQKEFGENVVIVAIDRAESREVAKKYSDELGVTDDLIFLLDPSDSFYRSIGGFSMPETLFVDKNGNIVQHKRGPMDLDEIKSRITNLINN